MKRILQLILILLTTVSYQTALAQWAQLGSKINGEATGDQFGRSLSVSGDGLTIAIGGHANDGNGADAGHVRVFKNIAGTWEQQGGDIDGEAASDYSGGSVSLSNDGLIVAIGAIGNSVFKGHTRIFKNVAGTWVQQGADIDGVSLFGSSVSLSSDGLTVVIGSRGSSAPTKIYKYISGTWLQQGADIDGEVSGDKSGHSVSISGDGLTVAIGAPNNDGNGADAGHVRIFKNVAGTWVQQGGDIDGEAAGDESGSSISLTNDGLTVAIGAMKNEGNGANAGHVRVYKNVAGTWVQQGGDIDGEAASDRSGHSVSLSDDGITVVIGAVGNVGGATGASPAGHARVYRNVSGTWVQLGGDFDGEYSGDAAGWSVGISNDGLKVAVAAMTTGVNVGSVKIYEHPIIIELVTSITVQGEAGASTIAASGGTLQMEAVILPANADDATYTWSVTNGTGSATIDANGLLTAMTDGDVTVTASANDASGITGSAIITLSNQIASINKYSTNNLSIYPNPVKSQLIIDSEERIEVIFITDVTGRVLEFIDKPIGAIDVSDLTKGVYFLQIQIDNVLVSKRFIKE
ncbi:MAG: hypothetical protein COA58_13985 [Bacteroidetes bacterium]|nr:MAG: hypothetical protein COA58_13985 [Bacteroidota bacterium]